MKISKFLGLSIYKTKQVLKKTKKELGRDLNERDLALLIISESVKLHAKEIDKFLK